MKIQIQWIKVDDSHDSCLMCVYRDMGCCSHPNHSNIELRTDEWTCPDWQYQSGFSV